MSMIQTHLFVVKVRKLLIKLLQQAPLYQTLCLPINAEPGQHVSSP